MEIKVALHEAITQLKQLINTPSVSRDEVAAAELIANFLNKRGVEVHRKGNNVWSIAPNFDSHKPTLLLNAHLDTVKPSAAWIRNPYMAHEEDGRIYGLGSNDDGASLIALLHAFYYLSNRPQSYNLIYLASAEEEISGSGGVELVLPLLPPICVALVGEPTEMHPAIAEKGLMVLDLTAHGKSGHAARNEGENALYKALDDISWIRNHRFSKVSELLGEVKMTATLIQAGSQHNVVPDQCSFTVDVRSNELYSNEELYELIKIHVTSDVKARSFRLNSSRIDLAHPLVKRSIELGRRPFGSPTLSDQALMHFPSLKMGPGQSARSHTADEFIKITELEEAIQLYIKLLDGISLV